MLSKEEFEKKYNSKWEQKYEESFLDTVDPADREMFDDVEILTGRNMNGKVNKFNRLGKDNKGKTYNTIKQRMITSFNKFCDEKISSGEIDLLWERVFKSGKGGNFNFAKLFLDRSIGKEEENINLNGDMTFSFEPDKKSIKRKKENKEK